MPGGIIFGSSQGGSVDAFVGSTPYRVDWLVGASADLTWGTSEADQDQTISELTAAGVQTVRLTIEWRSYETSNNTYDAWYQAHVDRAINLCDTANLHVVVVVLQAPQWASGSVNPQAPPQDPATYAEFMGYVAARYSGKVAGWEIWNEQNTARFWPPSPSPTAYTALLQAAYPAIKSADPNASVVLGGIAALASGSYEFLEDVYAAGAKDYFDVLGWHPYSLAGEAPDATIRYDGGGRIMHNHFLSYREARTIALANDDTVPIWMTEFGWSTSTQVYDPVDGDPWSTGVSEATQATYLTTAFELMEADLYVKIAHWYNFRNNYWENDADLIEARFGLLRTNFSHKPSYDALAAYIG